jgi:hypothetical protein
MPFGAGHAAFFAEMTPKSQMTDLEIHFMLFSATS